VYKRQVQGLGLGLVFVPLTTLAYATLEPKFRADAAAFFSLVRNIGSSIGISVVSALLVHNTQVNHAELSAGMTPYNPVLRHALPGAVMGDPASLSALDGLVTKQALMVAYVDDFKFMFIVTLIAMGLALFLRPPAQRPTGIDAAAMAE